ncbi:MAG: glutaminase [Pseudomonadota bacterium]
MTDLQEIVDAIAASCSREVDRGAVARYIPQLAHVDPMQFGIAVVTGTGEEFVAGDCDVGFSIQSVSKVFTLTLALQKVGDALWDRVGREPSGDPFNSIVQLEHEAGLPRNPFINAGAIVIADVLLAGGTPAAALDEVVTLLRQIGEDSSIAVDGAVAKSEIAHGARNMALASFMKAYGNLKNEPVEALQLYSNACAIAMSCRQLARAGRYLAWDGHNGPKGPVVTSSETARRVNSLMLTCGHYDGSGEFAYSVGIPGKSGVGGGILAIVPGIASIGCWSPGLNAVGNSMLATKALELLAARTGWSVFSGQS